MPDQELENCSYIPVSQLHIWVLPSSSQHTDHTAFLKCLQHCSQGVSLLGWGSWHFGSKCFHRRLAPAPHWAISYHPYLFLQWSSTSGYLENSGWPTCEGMQLLPVVGSFPKSDSWLRDDSNDNQATCVIFPWLQPVFCLCFLLTVIFSPKSVRFSYSYLMLREVSCIYLMKPGCIAACFLPLIYSWICSVIKKKF